MNFFYELKLQLNFSQLPNDSHVDSTDNDNHNYLDHKQSKYLLLLMQFFGDGE